MINLAEIFEKYDNEYIRFERVKNKLHSRPDLCALLLLDKLMPTDKSIISDVEHGEFYLSVDCEKLAEVASEQDILTLVRCGVVYNSYFLSLMMFVQRSKK